MVRTTVTLPPELLERLKRIAAERDVPLSVVIREALEEKAAEEAPSQSGRPLPKSLGIADSGYTDTSELASDPWIYRPRSWH